MSGTRTAPTMTSQAKVRHKRRRAVYSCLSCRRKKTKCDRESPCSQCIADNLAVSCEYQQTSSTPKRLDIRASRPESRESLQPDQTIGSSHQSSAAEPAPFTGFVSKTRVHGPGHWMAAQSMVHVLPVFNSIGAPFVSAFCSSPHGDQVDGMADLALKCKMLGRTIKGRGGGSRRLAEDFQRVVPDASATKALIEIYFCNFESGYCILHQHSFDERFKKHLEDPSATTEAFLIQILLVMAIAAPVHVVHDDNDPQSVTAWMTIAESWLSHSVQKEQLSIVVLQCQCLLLLARQVNRMGSDLVWISCGFVLRMAIQMGLHQDPDCFENMSVQEKEVRRRLWYSILEMDVQSAVDSGVVSTIRPDDYNTKLPSPLAEEEELTSTKGQHGVMFQRRLATSLPLRLRILAAINDTRKKSSYEDILSLSKEMEIACQDFATWIAQKTTQDGTPPTNTFATSHCTHMLHRFNTSLHYRYGTESATSPLYSYSHRVCLLEAQNLIALLDDDVLYARVLVAGGGMFRDVITHCTMALFMEINTELEANAFTTLPTSRRRHRLDPLLADAQRLLRHARDRLLKGDTQIKSYVTLSMLLAHVEARAENHPSEEAVSEALYNALHECHAVLEKKSMQSERGKPEDGNVQSWTPFDMSYDFLEDGIFSTDFGSLEFLDQR